MHQQLYIETAVPQLVVDPLADRVLEANLEACRLLRRDREALRDSPASRLFAGSLPELVVFTGEVLENTRGHTDQLQVNINGERYAVESSCRRGDREGEPLLHLSLQLVDELEQRRERADAHRHYRDGIGHWSRVARVFR